MCVVAALVAGFTPAIAFAGPRAGLAPCELSDVAGPAYCGSLEVPENPDRPQARTLSIHYAVLPANAGPARADPVVVLMGGPGEAAIAAAGVFAERFAELRDERDLLFVDMRGTGRSAALHCDLHADADAASRLRHFLPPDAAQRCARAMRSRADLDRYTYADTAGDLEQVRRALGYGPLNLSGGSYGTRAAMMFVKRYPDSVRTVYLGSVVPLDVTTPLTMAKSAQAQFDRVLRDCAADAACHRAYPDLERELATIIARLDAGQVKVPNGDSSEVTLSRGRVVEWFRGRLYRPSDGAELPWLVHQAYSGNWTPIVEGIQASATGMASALSVGFWLTMTCREDVAFIREDGIAPATRGTFLGDYRVREQMAACVGWPKTALPDGYRDSVHSSVPTLFVSGEDDAASPPWFTARVAPGFTNRADIVSRHQGHTEWSPCVARAYAQLVRDGSTRGIATRVCEDAAVPRFRLR
jgi:pimeloyl-ACP methyl ester carboxylesterase